MYWLNNIGTVFPLGIALVKWLLVYCIHYSCKKELRKIEKDLEKTYKNSWVNKYPLCSGKFNRDSLVSLSKMKWWLDQFVNIWEKVFLQKIFGLTGQIQQDVYQLNFSHRSWDFFFSFQETVLWHKNKVWLSKKKKLYEILWLVF